jgi:hypothetical protein
MWSPWAGLRYRFHCRARAPAAGQLADAPAQQQHALHVHHRFSGAPGQSQAHQRLGRPGAPGRVGDRAQSEELRRRPLGYLAAWGYALKKNNGDDKKAQDFVTRLYRTFRCSIPARADPPPLSPSAASATCCSILGERGLSGPERARQGQGGSGHAFDQHSGRAAGRGGRPGRRQTRHHAGGQGVSRIPVHRRGPGDRRRNYYRPRSTEVAAKYAGRFAQVQLFTIDEVFGGWQKAQKRHFDDGGVFDQIYASEVRPLACQRWLPIVFG